MPRITLKYLKKEVKRLTGNDSNLLEFNTALILMASIVVGPNVKRLAKFCGLQRSFIYPISKRLRQNRVWVKHKVGNNWFDKDGWISFNCDVCVALGWFRRVGHNKNV